MTTHPVNLAAQLLVLLAVGPLPFACGGGSDAPPSATGGAGGDGGAPSCERIEEDYAAAFEAAAACDPSATVDPCTERVVEGLACSCDAFVNPEHAAAIERALAAQHAWNEQQCSAGIQCGACLEPTSGLCSSEGRCQNVYASAGRGCKVDGVVYADGDEGIPDPTSCNTCSCVDGELVCTEIYCPTPCPELTAIGKQCAACGPVDQCEVVEHACLPTCVDTCSEGSCVGGLCLVGLCG